MQAIQQEEDNQFRGLLTIGRERGYLFVDEVNVALASGGHSEKDVGRLFTTLESDGIELSEDTTAAQADRGELEIKGKAEFETPLDLSADELHADLKCDPLDRTTDLVKTYLREMGVVPLLTALDSHTKTIESLHISRGNRAGSLDYKHCGIDTAHSKFKETPWPSHSKSVRRN